MIPIAEGLGRSSCPITSLAQTTDGTIYAGGCDDESQSYHGAVYDSNDGMNWGLGESQLDSPIQSLASSGNTLYAGGETYDGGKGSYLGVIFSFNNGLPEPRKLYESIVGFGSVLGLASSRDGTLYTGNFDSNGFGLVSAISAQSAFTIESGIGSSSCPRTALAIDQSGNLYASGCDQGGYGGIYLYKDDAGPGIEIESNIVGGIHSLAIANGGTVYVGGFDESGFGALYSFSNSNLNLNKLKIRIGVQGCAINSIAVDNSNGTVYAGGCDESGFGAIYSYINESWSMIESRVGYQSNQSILSLILQY